MVLPTSENALGAAVIAGARNPPSRLRAAPAKGARRPAGKSKKDQLVALIARPFGAKISVLTERLGWQVHTIRGALSRLGKQGHCILATKAQKTGEAVYRLVPPTQVTADDPPAAASEA